MLYELPTNENFNVREKKIPARAPICYGFLLATTKLKTRI